VIVAESGVGAVGVWIVPFVLPSALSRVRCPWRSSYKFGSTCTRQGVTMVYDIRDIDVPFASHISQHDGVPNKLNKIPTPPLLIFLSNQSHTIYCIGSCQSFLSQAQRMDVILHN